MLVEGVIAPVAALIVKPAVEVYVPPLVPVNDALCAVEILEQNGVPLYEIVAAGAVVIVTEVVVVNKAQPPLAATV